MKALTIILAAILAGGCVTITSIITPSGYEYHSKRFLNSTDFGGMTIETADGQKIEVKGVKSESKTEQAEAAAKAILDLIKP